MNNMTKDNRAAWYVFAFFALMLFAKCVLFHWSVFHYSSISLLWKDPLGFYKFYMAKLLMPLFIASFVFLTKRNWWTCLASFIIDIWLIANAVYYRAYDSFLSVNDILLVGNMGGAWTSITTFFDRSMAVYLVMTVAWCIFIIKLPRYTKRACLTFGLLFATIYLLAYLNNYFIKNPYFIAGCDVSKLEQGIEWNRFMNKHGGHLRIPDDPQWYLPFYDVAYAAAKNKNYVSSKFMSSYVSEQSILSDFVAIIVHHLFQRELRGEIIALSGEDVREISRFVKDDGRHSALMGGGGDLVILLVESLESWPIDDDIEEQCVAPCLRRLSKQNHILYCNRVKNQTLGGASGDGQMIINTGLLPIADGAACMSYSNNVFPNTASRFKSSCIINPWPKIWNQDVMYMRYGYNQLCEPKDEQWEDADVLDETIRRLKESTHPTCIMALTVSMHCPFNRITNDRVNTHAASFVNRYLQCLNYTDSRLGAFMQEVLDDPALSQSTIVITGDHTVFKPTMLTEFKEYAVRENLSIASGENFCPLIVYSPAIEGNVRVADLCYQMDIYPTVKHLIGCADDGWQGFGINLLDPDARSKRPIDEQEACRLSDLMIRSDYFRRYPHQQRPGGKPDTVEDH